MISTRDLEGVPVNQIKPIRETPETVTVSRSDFEAMHEQLEDAEDKIAVLEDCLLDMKPHENRYLLTMDETMRIIEGESPLKIWREERGLTVRDLSDALGVHAVEIEELENPEAEFHHKDMLEKLYRVASHLDVLPDMLIPPEVTA